MDKALARRPPDDVVEGELIVRSPSLGWGQVLFMVATIVGFTVWHNWLYGHPLSRALKPYNVVVGLLVFVVVVLKYVVVPPWLRISSAGIAFGQGARSVAIGGRTSAGSPCTTGSTARSIFRAPRRRSSP